MTAPRLSAAVGRLTGEHVQMSGLVDDLVARTSPGEGEDVDTVRGLGTSLLGLLASHRQRGSDPVYEAYEFDVGGQT